MYMHIGDGLDKWDKLYCTGLGGRLRLGPRSGSRDPHTLPPKGWKPVGGTKKQRAHLDTMIGMDGL